MPSAKKLRGKKKKKAKEQRRDALALDTGPVQMSPDFLASVNLDDSGNAVPRADGQVLRDTVSSSRQTTRMRSTQGSGRPSTSINTMAKVISVVRESQPQLIRLPPNGYWAANDADLSELTDSGLLGALLI
ncbi:hypothetical protein THAOC_04403, partial [Thalassiosira oceanica]